jgi:hypothetical protein
MTNFPDNIIALTFHYDEGASSPPTNRVTGSYNPLSVIEKYGIRVTGNEFILIPLDLTP